MMGKLQAQLLTREWELDSREGAIATWEDGLVAFKHALGRACMEHKAERTEAEAVRQDYLARMCTFTFGSKNSLNFSRTLEECQNLLSLQETGLEVWEVKLAEEHARDLHSYNRRDLSVELQELHVHVVGVKDEGTTEAGELSQLVIEISNSLVALGTLPIRDIP
jgi:hypothetical protein